LRETFGIERAENLRLRDFPTLRHVVRFVYDHRPDLAPATAEAVPPAPAAELLPVPVKRRVSCPASDGLR